MQWIFLFILFQSFLDGWKTIIQNSKDSCYNIWFIFAEFEHKVFIFSKFRTIGIMQTDKFQPTVTKGLKEKKYFHGFLVKAKNKKIQFVILGKYWKFLNSFYTHTSEIWKKLVTKIIRHKTVSEKLFWHYIKTFRKLRKSLANNLYRLIPAMRLLLSNFWQ